MAIILGGVELNPDMIWSDEFQIAEVAQTHIRTLGGTSVVYSQQLSAGIPITLEATRDQGWLTKEQVKNINALHKQAGGQFPLVLGSQSFLVIFRHHEGVAFTAEPLIARIDGSNNDWYAPVTIRLMTL